MTDFDAIYAAGGWNGMGSGPGSTPGFTKGFRKVLQDFLYEEPLSSVFEPGCGDWQWQSLVNWGRRTYLGIDIVESVIIQNVRRFPHFFAHADVFQLGIWPKTDLMIVKDLVHHIPQDRVRTLIRMAYEYPCVLWVLDMEGDTICNWPDDVSADALRLIYDFDLTIENYPYGRKAAFLQVNS